MFKLEIETSNAAFEEDPTPEVTRILQGLSVLFDEDSPLIRAESGKVFDTNGNTVGKWEYTPE